MAGDRDRDVNNGSHIGKVTFTLQAEPDVGAKGTMEYVVWRTERSQATPVLGTQLPTSAESASQGIQQAYRQHLPGWVMKFGAFPVTAEQANVRTISVNPDKFIKHGWRDGDHLGLTLHNRTVGTINWSCQMRYKEYI